MAAGLHHRPAADTLRLQRGTRGLDVAGVHDEMHQARLDGNGGLQCRVVHVEPALGCCAGRPFGLWIDGDDFKIGQRIGRRGDLEQAVVGAILRVFTPRAGRDADRGLAPLHPKLQRLRHDDQVINLCFHDLTIPSTRGNRSSSLHGAWDGVEAVAMQGVGS